MQSQMDTRIPIRIPAEDKRRLAEVAAERGQSLSAFIRELAAAATRIAA